MSSPLCHRFGSSVLITLTLACGESTGPGVTPAIYVLRQVEQDPLPTLLVNNGNYATYVFSDTIRLRGNKTGTISGVQESVPLLDGLPAEGPVHITIEFRYTLAGPMGDRVEIAFECPPNANCVAPPHLIARRVPGGLTAHWASGMLGRSPLLYTEAEDAP